MSTITRFAVLAMALVSLSAVLSSTAGAVTWTNTGDTTFHATSGPTTVTSTGHTLICTKLTVTGHVGTSPFVGNTWTAFTGTLTSNPSDCTIEGTSTDVHCRYSFTATTWFAGTPARTTGNTDFFCRLYQFTTQICFLAGADHTIYTNPAPGAKTGRLTLTTGGGLTSASPAGETCPFGENDTVHLLETTFTMTASAAATVGPFITTD